MKSDSGATPERSDVAPQEAGDKCPMHPSGGRHYWQWQDLLKMRRCSTCGETREWTKRFQGQ